MAEEDNVAAVDSSVCGQGQKAPDSSTSKVPVDGAAEHDLTIFFGRKNTSPVLKLVTARIVVEYGMRFQSICARPTLSVLVRNAIVSKNIAGQGKMYDELQTTNPGSEKALLDKFAAALGKTARQHKVAIAEMVAQLFEQTDCPQINHVKKTVFGIDGGGPIKHPTIDTILKIVPRGALSVFIACNAS